MEPVLPENMSGIFVGSAGSEFLGTIVEITDFNNDGIDDYVIGAQGGNGFAGTVHVVFGKAEPFPSVFDLNDLGDTEYLTLVNSAPGVIAPAFGDQIATGDFNGDGLNDIAVASPEDSSGAGSDAGVVSIFYGRSAEDTETFLVDTLLGANIWDSQTLNGVDGENICGTEAGMRLGALLENMGDLDGDGGDELGIGTGRFGTTNELYIYYSNDDTSAPETALDALPINHLASITGLADVPLHATDLPFPVFDPDFQLWPDPPAGQGSQAYQNDTPDILVGLTAGGQTPGNVCVFNGMYLQPGQTLNVPDLLVNQGFMIQGGAGPSGLTGSAVRDLDVDGIPELWLGYFHYDDGNAMGVDWDRFPPSVAVDGSPFLLDTSSVIGGIWDISTTALGYSTYGIEELGGTDSFNDHQRLLDWSYRQIATIFGAGNTPEERSFFEDKQAALEGLVDCGQSFELGSGLTIQYHAGTLPISFPPGGGGASVSSPGDGGAQFAVAQPTPNAGVIGVIRNFAMSDTPPISNIQVDLTGIARDLDPTLLDGNNGYLIVGEQTFGGTGWEMGYGDMNGDGIQDMVFSAPFHDSQSLGGNGAVYTVRGGEKNMRAQDHQDGMRDGVIHADQLGATPELRAGLILTTELDFSEFGTAFARLGDIDGDGIDDFLIGEPGAATGAPGAGRAVLIHGDHNFGAPEIVLDTLTPEQGAFLNGAALFDAAGSSVAGPGDINGDGLADLLIGVPGMDRGANGTAAADAGAAYAVYGRPTPFALQTDLAALGPASGTEVEGRDASDRFGTTVAGIGDINDDGRPDFAVAAPQADPGSRPEAGEILVIFGQGSDLPVPIAPGDLDGTNGFVIQGAAMDDLAGTTISAAGDLDGDGIDDFVIGSPGQGLAGPGSEGNLDIILGSDAGFPAVLDLGAAVSPIPRLRLEGEIDQGRVGSALDATGDFNGDGVNDIAFGLPLTDLFGGINAGAAGLVFGSQLPFDGANPPEGPDGMLFTNARAGAFTGIEVSYAGDVNGDGFDDVLIGAIDELFLVFGRPDVPAGEFDLSTLDGTNGYRITGAGPGEGFGQYFGGIGDVDGDGFDDIAIGIPDAGSEKPGDAGCVVVLFGGSANWAGMDIADGTWDGEVDFHSATGLFVESAISLPGDGVVNGTFLDDVFGLGMVDYNGDFVTAQADTIRGAEGNDFLSAHDGDDLVEGGTGNDTLFGQQGNDTLSGEAGEDWIEGGDGEDVASGGDGADTILGGADNDDISGGNGADSVEGGDGADIISGGAENDTLKGGDGNDVLSGDFGDDHLEGGAEDDDLAGGADNDLVQGGDGADTLRGDAGDDTLEGGAGADTFVVNPGDGLVLITDFELGVDTLDLSGFARADAVLALNGAQAGSAILTFSDGTVLTVDGPGVTPDTLGPGDLALAAGNLAPEGSVTVTGTPEVGAVLSADVSGVSDPEGINPGTVTYQWQRDGVDIAGATGPSYTLVAADVGAQIRVVYGYTDTFGAVESVTSDPTGTVEPLDYPTEGAPVITGTAEEDATLSVDLSGMSDGDGINAASYAYQWLRGGVEIAGATGPTLTLDQPDVGAEISVAVSYTDLEGNPGGATSDPVGPVANVDDPTLGSMILTGDPVLGGVLMSDRSGISDADGIDEAATTYYWTRAGSFITGATSDTYTITEADLGNFIYAGARIVDLFGNVTFRSGASVWVNTPASGSVAIAGLAQEAEALTVDLSGIVEPDGLTDPGYSYQWLRGGVEIAGATGASYIVAAEDVFAELTVRVSYTDDGGTQEVFTSAAVSPRGIPQLLVGTPEADTLTGGNGDDTIQGLGDDDALTGAAADDVIDGGDGTDTALYSGTPESYTVALNSDGTVRVTDRRAEGLGDGSDLLSNVELIDFDGVVPGAGDPLNLAKFGGPAGLEAEALEGFIELYIAYFNRAPDAVGLNFWGSRYADGRTLEFIAERFSLSEETQATYPEGTTTQDFVEAVYNNVLGRLSDPLGLANWVDKLDSGRLTRDTFILKILAGAKSDLKPELGEDFVNQQLADRKYLEDKTDIGAYFAVIRGMSDVEDARDAMGFFDGTEASITAAVAAIDGHYAEALDPVTGDFLMPLVGVLDDPFAIV